MYRAGCGLQVTFAAPFKSDSFQILPVSVRFTDIKLLPVNMQHLQLQVLTLNTEQYRLYGEVYYTFYYDLFQVHNHLSRSVHVLCEKSALEATGALPEDYSKNPFHDKFVRLACLAPDDVYDLPLLVAYHCKLYVRLLPTECDAKE